ncbi:hypothetical protein [Serinibacter arcticus]|uniref:hypothetical protein n=1 Tax=Serinibacter arcticus TaxID=1655435 RepID=UPI0011B2133C|nr:hypothetical protein [Serinibacter arcticus]
MRTPPAFRRYPYAPFAIAAFVGALASITVVAVVQGTAMLGATPTAPAVPHPSVRSRFPGCCCSSSAPG